MSECRTPCARCAGPDQEVAALGSRVDPGPTCGLPLPRGLPVHLQEAAPRRHLRQPGHRMAATGKASGRLARLAGRDPFPAITERVAVADGLARTERSAR